MYCEEGGKEKGGGGGRKYEEIGEKQVRVRKVKKRSKREQRKTREFSCPYLPLSTFFLHVFLFFPSSSFSFILFLSSLAFFHLHLHLPIRKAMTRVKKIRIRQMRIKFTTPVARPNRVARCLCNRGSRQIRAVERNVRQRFAKARIIFFATPRHCPRFEFVRILSLPWRIKAYLHFYLSPWNRRVARVIRLKVENQLHLYVRGAKI